MITNPCLPLPRVLQTGVGMLLKPLLLEHSLLFWMDLQAAS
jgi:hypothetical protein